MNLNDPSMFHPALCKRAQGRNNMGDGGVVEEQYRADNQLATAMNSICHQRRSAGTVPASATRDPMMVAGMAASAQDVADP